MSGMLFPKGGKRQRARKIHAKSSILQKDTDRRRCWLCMYIQHDYSEHAQGVLHKHHVYMGPLRDTSEEHGFYVYLCPQHHMRVHADRYSSTSELAMPIDKKLSSLSAILSAA